MAGKKVIAIVRHYGFYSPTFQGSLKSYGRHLKIKDVDVEEIEFGEGIDIVSSLQKGDHIVVDGGELGAARVGNLQATVQSNISEGSLSEEAYNRFKVWCLKPDLKLTE